MSALSIDIREKVFANGLRALDNLGFTTEQHQFTAIVGPSGAGKSTLLNIVAGLDTDVAGSVTTSDKRPHIGFMFQQARLLPWLSVRQNIELVIEGLPPAEHEAARARCELLLEQVGLGDFTETFPGQLSIGMQRRVSLVRAFVIQPGLLLMDEPFQSLDEPTAEQLRELLLDLWRETRASVLFVTHNLREALALADRVLFLSARPATVILDYQVKAERPRPADGPAVCRLHDELLRRHPEILSGAINR